MKKIILSFVLSLFFVVSMTCAAEESTVIGDKALLDTAFTKGFILHLEQVFAAHPLAADAVSDSQAIFSSPRAELTVVTNKSANQSLHYHAVADEIMYIVKGQGEIYLGGKWAKVAAGQLHINPRGVIHGLKVTGDEPLEMISFFAPPPPFGNDKVLLDQVTPPVDGKIAAYDGFLDSEYKQGLLVPLDQFIATHPHKNKDASRVDTIYKSPRCQVVFSTVAAALIDIHYHTSCDEIILIYKGKGEIYVDGKWTAVKAGDLHVNPRGIYHAIRSNGADDLQIISVFTPPQSNGNDLIYLQQ